LVSRVEAPAPELDSGGFILSAQCRGALGAVIVHFDIVDATENMEDIPASWTFIFIFHRGRA